jgi:D-apionate oxidoisomerase
MKMTTIALLGAGGKMGCRITDNLKDSNYKMHYVEVSPQGIENLAQRGLTTSPSEVALKEADVLVLAIPDNLIGKLSPEIIPSLKSGSMVICLDPAAPCAGRVYHRKDVSYFVTHPCHPSVFNYEETAEAQKDYFGGIKARQSIVCALMHGPEEDYMKGEQVAKDMFQPVVRSHRVTVEQMALLEPGLSETTSQTCIRAIREAMDEVIRRGVPEEAAKDFILGHINIQLAIFFGEVNVRFSDGAIKAMDRARSQLFQPDWMKVFEPENIKESLEAITRSPDSNS